MKYLLTIISFFLLSPVAFAAATFQTSATDSTLFQTSYTFTSQAIGTAASDRDVIVLVKLSGDVAASISGVTIGGVSATVISYNGGSSGASKAAIAIAPVPTGTTATVVVSLSGGQGFECGIGVYTANNINLTAYDSGHAAGVGTNPAPNVSINIPSSGFTIGVVGTQNDNSISGISWTNLTRDYQGAVRSNAWHSGASGAPSAQSGYSITANISSSGDTNYVMLAASFQENASSATSILGLVRSFWLN